MRTTALELAQSLREIEPGNFGRTQLVLQERRRQLHLRGEDRVLGGAGEKRHVETAERGSRVRFAQGGGPRRQVIKLVTVVRRSGHRRRQRGHLEVSDADELQERGEEGPVDVDLGPVAGDGLVLHRAQPGAGAVGVVSLQLAVGERRQHLEPGRARHGRLEREEPGCCLEGPCGIAGDSLGPRVPAEGTGEQRAVVQLVESGHCVVGGGERVGDTARRQQLLRAHHRHGATQKRALCRGGGGGAVHEGEPPAHEDRRRTLHDGVADDVGKLR